MNDMTSYEVRVVTQSMAHQASKYTDNDNGNDNFINKRIKRA